MKKINIFKNIIIFVVIFCSLCYTVDAILDQNLYRILIRLSVIPVIFLPKIINVTFKTKISDASEIIYIIFVFIAHFLGSVINLYGKIYWYDNFTHYLSGIVIAFFALELLYKLDRYDSKKIFFISDFLFKILDSDIPNFKTIFFNFSGSLNPNINLYPKKLKFSSLFFNKFRLDI